MYIILDVIWSLCLIDGVFEGFSRSFDVLSLMGVII